jgi:hypothetical protein
LKLVHKQWTYVFHMVIFHSYVSLFHMVIFPSNPVLLRIFASG